jgi:hypothetical protein
MWNINGSLRFQLGGRRSWRNGRIHGFKRNHPVFRQLHSIGTQIHYSHGSPLLIATVYDIHEDPWKASMSNSLSASIPNSLNADRPPKIPLKSMEKHTMVPAITIRWESGVGRLSLRLVPEQISLNTVSIEVSIVHRQISLCLLRPSIKMKFWLLPANINLPPSVQFCTVHKSRSTSKHNS